MRSNVHRRGFTTRLKRLKPRAPDFEGPQNFASNENFQHICNYIFFCSTHDFLLCLYSLTTDIYGTGSPTFLSEGHINYYTKVRGPKILRVGIVSGYVTFYQIKKFFVN